MARQMLMYRAASWWTNVYAPDLSMGLMTTEEAKDEATIVDAEYEEVTVQEKKHIAFKEEDQSPSQVVDTETGEMYEPASDTEEVQNHKPASAEELFG